jgi:hypothetical protein
MRSFSSAVADIILTSIVMNLIIPKCEVIFVCCLNHLPHSILFRLGKITVKLLLEP